jgi:hypothetical protein
MEHSLNGTESAHHPTTRAQCRIACLWKWNGGPNFWTVKTKIESQNHGSMTTFGTFLETFTSIVSGSLFDWVQKVSQPPFWLYPSKNHNVSNDHVFRYITWYIEYSLEPATFYSCLRSLDWNNLKYLGKDHTLIKNRNWVEAWNSALLD